MNFLKPKSSRYSRVSQGEDEETEGLQVFEIMEDFPEEREPPPIQKGNLPPLSHFQLFCLTISFLGIQFGWALQIGLTTPIFLSLGVTKEWVSYAWLAGPISGLLVQPIVGVLSDRTTHSWGRRRPYILYGSVAVIIGQLMISNAGSLSVIFGHSDHKNGLAIFLAVLGFWIMDLANNAVQGPCRALLVDVAPAEQQNLGGSLFSFMLGLGNLAGYAMASVNLIDYMPFFGSNQRIIFGMAMISLIICVGITVYFTPERRITQAEVGRKLENPFVKIWKAMMGMPKAMMRICAVQFFTWIAWFTVFLFGTAWVGEAIYGGNGNADEESESYKKFDRGVQFGSLALCVNSAITMGASVVLPILVRRFGIKAVYSFGQFFLGVCLIPTIFVSNRWVAFLLLSGLGIPWSVAMVLPFTLVAMTVDETKCGLYIGVLNIFVVIPQLVVALGIGEVIQLAHGNMAVAFVLGGISSLIASALCWGLIVKDEANVTVLSGGGGH